MTIRKIPLVEGEVYHIFSKSIAGFEIFRNNTEFERMEDLLRYYQRKEVGQSFSNFLKTEDKDRFYFKYISQKEKIVNLIAYCIMPTHIHLTIEQLKSNGISIFLRNILNSYTHYFNKRIKRKGPLWESRFKNVIVDTDDQLLHLTRYIHLNPVTAYIIDNPEDWKYSSYKEYLGKIKEKDQICDFSKYLDIEVESYAEFVKSQIALQRELALSKVILD